MPGVHHGGWRRATMLLELLPSSHGAVKCFRACWELVENQSKAQTQPGLSQGRFGKPERAF